MKMTIYDCCRRMGGDENVLGLCAADLLLTVACVMIDVLYMFAPMIQLRNVFTMYMYITLKV